jgi:hypothetical protein
MASAPRPMQVFVERVLTLPPAEERRASQQHKKRSRRQRRTVVVRVYKPKLSGSEWSCHFSVRTSKREVTSRALGEDGLQALIGALFSVHELVTTAVPDASWLSGQPGDTDLPIVILSGLPFPESEHLRRYVQDKATAFCIRVFQKKRTRNG